MVGIRTVLKENLTNTLTLSVGRLRREEMRWDRVEWVKGRVCVKTIKTFLSFFRGVITTPKILVPVLTSLISG